MNKLETKIKNSLKEASEQSPDYWENISKITNIPDNRRITMNQTKKPNIFKLRYVVPAVCGLALVATLSFMNLTGNKLPLDTKDPIVATQTVENLQINNILDMISAKIRLPENGTTEMVSYEAYLEQTNMNLNLWLPTELANTEDAFVYYNEDGSIFMMSGYTFSDPSTGAYITLRFQKDALPISDTRYALENENPSTINGEAIVIGYSADLDAYMAEFMYNGIGYSLTSGQGVTQDDFIHVIQSIIQ